VARVEPEVAAGSMRARVQQCASATGLFRETALHIPDDQYHGECTAVLAARIEPQKLPGPDPDPT
jgi:hypothetical protein